MFPKIVLPQNGWFILENPIKTDDLGPPLFLETQILRDFCLIFATCCTCRHSPTSQVVSSFRVGVLHHQPLRHARAAIKAKRQGQGKFQ